ncbi:peptidyl-prolyl cis-trans isomerase, cyclophilin-type [Ancylostoma ceylanicum]|uniref:Peptidyl-prolyl cis-trans isomerase, cyclophilin-type n=1 Tax=Ancylostoma ceylanicum TaxID=53326 RepID=A0A0D6M9H0_9BILA|nr:peptidyl-prolyl cis-trans isomerase, cyclophilin-type [Ancylostoma ceylanicum]
MYGLYFCLASARSNTNLEFCLNKCNKSQESAILLAGIKSWQDACAHLEGIIFNKSERSSHAGGKTATNSLNRAELKRHIIPYLKKNGVNPCTGKKMSSKDLIHLKFDKDDQGRFRCPVTFRQFTDHTHVVAIATTGNVFSYEAVQELNLKASHLKDLLTDTPFHRSDIIVLQDPHHLEKFNMEKFFHVQFDPKTKEEIEKEKKEMQIEPLAEETADEINAAHYRFCPKAPKTCENFILLCSRGYYNNTRFHRIIKNFMMQGGDPTGTGHGGESAWGKPFDDEFAPGLSHDARGILSMANKGTNTNQSQFFITFRPCKYLDKKHSIFGRVVGGQDTLIAIEKVETDGSDVPKDPVYFMRAEVFVDPFEEAEAEVQKERANLLNKDAQKEADAKKEALAKPKAYGTGVGKYINPQSKRPAGDVLDGVDKEWFI